MGVESCLKYGLQFVLKHVKKERAFQCDKGEGICITGATG